MDLATYLKDTQERPGAFARRIGVKPSTISGWLNDPKRGPSRKVLAAIEEATGGKVTARDFAWGEPCPIPTASGGHVAVTTLTAAEQIGARLWHRAVKP